MKTDMYLQKSIVAMFHHPIPGSQRGLTRDGYTVRRGAPTSYMVLLEGETRYRRVYVWQFSNSGTTFVRIKGEPLVIPTGEL